MEEGQIRDERMNDYDAIIVALRRITRAIHLHSKRLVRTSGLTAPQLIIMQTIQREGQTSASMLAKKVALSQATVTTILDRLERGGLIERRRSESDKRVVHVHLTAAGAEKLDIAPELLQAGFLREFRKLEDWERHMLTASLERIAAMMDAGDLDASPILDVGELDSSGPA